MEAIYDVIDEILDDGDRLTRAVAEEVVEDAADEASATPSAMCSAPATIRTES